MRPLMTITDLTFVNNFMTKIPPALPLSVRGVTCWKASAILSAKRDTETLLDSGDR